MLLRYLVIPKPFMIAKAFCTDRIPPFTCKKPSLATSPLAFSPTNPATIFAIPFTVSGFLLTKSFATLSTSVTFPTTFVSVGNSSSPSDTCSASQADCINVICPLRLSSLVSAIFFAAPSALFMDSVNLSKSFCSAFINAKKPEIPDWPAIFFA